MGWGLAVCLGSFYSLLRPFWDELGWSVFLSSHSINRMQSLIYRALLTLWTPSRTYWNNYMKLWSIILYHNICVDSWMVWLMTSPYLVWKRTLFYCCGKNYLQKPNFSPPCFNIGNFWQTRSMNESCSQERQFETGRNDI